MTVTVAETCSFGLRSDIQASVRDSISLSIQREFRTVISFPVGQSLGMFIFPRNAHTAVKKKQKNSFTTIHT